MRFRSPQNMLLISLWKTYELPQTGNKNQPVKGPVLDCAVEICWPGSHAASMDTTGMAWTPTNLVVTRDPDVRTDDKTVQNIYSPRVGQFRRIPQNTNRVCKSPDQAAIGTGLLPQWQSSQLVARAAVWQDIAPQGRHSEQRRDPPHLIGCCSHCSFNPIYVVQKRKMPSWFSLQQASTHLYHKRGPSWRLQNTVSFFSGQKNSSWSPSFFSVAQWGDATPPLRRWHSRLSRSPPCCLPLWRPWWDAKPGFEGKSSALGYKKTNFTQYWKAGISTY